VLYLDAFEISGLFQKQASSETHSGWSLNAVLKTHLHSLLLQQLVSKNCLKAKNTDSFVLNK
jgi:hypothetical protein